MNYSGRTTGDLLIVDDTHSDLRLLETILCNIGHRVRAFTTGRQALAAAMQELPDLVLLDVRMPGMNGYEVCESLQSMPKLAKVPVIFISGLTETNDKVTGFKAGGVDFLTKPLQPEEIVARVTVHLKLQQRERQLVQNFEEMKDLTAQLEARNGILREVLGIYSGSPIAEALLDSVKPLELGGEIGKVTMLFADLRDFTGMSAKLVPTQIVNILNAFFECVLPVITKYGGTIDNIMADGILVLFGAPSAAPDDAQRAVACAVEMQRAIELFNKAKKPSESPPLGMGIGINTGDVVIGNIGTSKRMKYSVIGSPVNVASRIESLTSAGQILVSESTLLEVATIARVDGHLRVKLKGLQEPVEVYDIGGIGGNCGVFLRERLGALDSRGRAH